MIVDCVIEMYKIAYVCAGTWEPGGPGGACAPLEFGFYRVKIFKMDKISFSLLFGPPR